MKIHIFVIEIFLDKQFYMEPFFSSYIMFILRGFELLTLYLSRLRRRYYATLAQGTFIFNEFKKVVDDEKQIRENTFC